VTAPADTESARALLRHTLATLAYRGGKALRGSPPGFHELRVAETVRTPGEILAHIGDLLDWALSMTRGKHEWRATPPLPWDQEVARFFAALQALDDRLAGEAALAYPPEQLFQGPIADALQHVGQIALLRRLAGAPVRAENYFRAEITTGRVGADQAPPQREFD
jgi:hypothetical protein